MTDNLYEIAARRKFRFMSNKGPLTVEQLFDLPLQSTSVRASLDNVAREVNAQLKAITEDSFVETRVNPEKAELEQKLELVKSIIAAKLAENELARQRVEKAAEKDKLLALLADKRDESLKSLSEDELRAKLAELSS